MDCTNPIAPGMKWDIGHTTSGGEQIAATRGDFMERSQHGSGFGLAIVFGWEHGYLRLRLNRESSVINVNIIVHARIVNPLRA
jgi:hypothetical protein